MFNVVAGLLTKKFISLIHEAKDGTLDLNKTADVLEVCFGSILILPSESELFTSALDLTWQVLLQGIFLRVLINFGQVY